ncbi:hypothetical protein [Pepper vein yellows virus-associated RNA]|nr:hypothetical protein [Pepper vein yellows virus-associated RNA]
MDGLRVVFEQASDHVVTAFKARPFDVTFDRVVSASTVENPLQNLGGEAFLAVPHNIMGHSLQERLLESLATFRVGLNRPLSTLRAVFNRSSRYIGVGMAISAVVVGIVERWRASQAPPLSESPARIEDCLEIDDPDLQTWEDTIPAEPLIERSKAQLAMRRKLKRRVRPSATNKFIRVLRAEVKSTVGTPSYTAANVAVIRHIVDKYAEEYNIRKSSYSHLLGDVISAVMTPYKAEYRQTAYCGSLTSRLRRWLVELK